MAQEIILHHVNYSKATYDNGTLIMEKRTGGTIRHFNVPWSVFNGLELTGNSDTYYENNIRNKYPVG